MLRSHPGAVTLQGLFFGLVTHICPRVRTSYQMTCPVSENVVSFPGMKHLSLAYIGGGVIVAVMFLAVFVGGANACHHNAETAEQTSTAVPQKADEKIEVEA